jgi:hypothetical protein
LEAIQMHLKRVLGTAGIGLFAIVWTLVQAAEGEWAFYALACALAVATNLTIMEMSNRRPEAASSSAPQPEASRLSEHA